MWVMDRGCNEKLERSYDWLEKNSGSINKQQKQWTLTLKQSSCLISRSNEIRSSKELCAIWKVATRGQLLRTQLFLTLTSALASVHGHL